MEYIRYFLDTAFFSSSIAIATQTPATAIQTLCRGRRLDPRSLLAQQRRRQNGSPPLKYSTAFTTLIISSEWLLKAGSAR